MTTIIMPVPTEVQVRWIKAWKPSKKEHKQGDLMASGQTIFFYTGKEWLGVSAKRMVDMLNSLENSETRSLVSVNFYDLVDKPNHFSMDLIDDYVVIPRWRGWFETYESYVFGDIVSSPQGSLNVNISRTHEPRWRILSNQYLDDVMASFLNHTIKKVNPNQSRTIKV